MSFRSKQLEIILGNCAFVTFTRTEMRGHGRATQNPLAANPAAYKHRSLNIRSILRVSLVASGSARVLRIELGLHRCVFYTLPDA